MTTATPQQVQKKTPAAAATEPVRRPAGGMTPDQAATKLSSILNPGAKPKKATSGNDILSDGKARHKNTKQAQETQQKPKKAAPKEAQQGHADGDADEADATGDLLDDQIDLEEGDAELDTTDEEGDNADPSDEGADDESADTDEGEGEEDDTLYTVKVGGKKEQVTLSELLKGYSRTGDYLQKTAAVAKERKEVEALKETVKDLPQQRETYMKGAERFTQNAAVMAIALQQKFMPKQPDPELAKTDPAAYYAAKEAHQDALQFTQALQQEVGQIAAKQQADAKDQHAKLVQEGRKKLYEAMPEMQTAPARQKLREYANSLGFSDEQIANEASHTLFVCVEKARRWDELQAQRKNIQPKAPLQKVARRTNAAETKRAVSQRDKQEVISAHRQKGTMKTAEKALMAIFTEDGK